ncbi:hypothetical protein [Desulfofundulus thermosubterraneus]|uniref:HepT-like domain-containing protein n=1 Tax=Desulfofundulus thermosubterraneus DSM 16057 TaxID=1121432 RepID=A0A1M6E8V8_9FIRM|nr:hypothetical protein [Desulfofundulus thermosubterraneus]SHI81809.1 hypothetical protein SAMN02745219_01146 [Desulfofundulus thermosubterraneus DSM 16057]
MRDREQLLTLASEISDRLKDLEVICRHGKQWLDIHSAKAPGILDLRALGSILHDFYTAMEDIFELIAGDINGKIPQDSRWHKRLLHLMTLDIPKLRPAVISKELEAQLEDYLRFRNVFRNVYGHQLQWARMSSLIHNLDCTCKKFAQEIEAFRRFLLRLAEQLEGDV